MLCRRESGIRTQTFTLDLTLACSRHAHPPSHSLTHFYGWLEQLHPCPGWQTQHTHTEARTPFLCCTHSQSQFCFALLGQAADEQCFFLLSVGHEGSVPIRSAPLFGDFGAVGGTSMNANPTKNNKDCFPLAVLRSFRWVNWGEPPVLLRTQLCIAPVIRFWTMTAKKPDSLSCTCGFAPHSSRNQPPLYLRCGCPKSSEVQVRSTRCSERTMPVQPMHASIMLVHPELEHAVPPNFLKDCSHAAATQHQDSTRKHLHFTLLARAVRAYMRALAPSRCTLNLVALVSQLRLDILGPHRTGTEPKQSAMCGPNFAQTGSGLFCCGW